MLSSENDGFLRCETETSQKEEGSKEEKKGKEQEKNKTEEKGKEKNKGKKQEKGKEEHKDKEAPGRKIKKIDENKIDISCLKCLMHDFDLKRSFLHESLTSLLRNTQVILLYCAYYIEQTWNASRRVLAR